ncbi:hypothetical protein VDG1235_2749 [Verrucomicrobiia bacterium DG1235]|nr:hypothetical protein VDG1235_2749 [Verrucomicrobiae bacterium DG1235]
MANATEANSDKLKILLLTGQSGPWHNWRVSSPALREAMESASIFEVDTLVTPAAGESFEGFSPRWSDYAAVVLVYEGDSWPEAVKASFVEYMRGGGGLVVYHDTDNAFPDWPEYNEMIGVGGWAGRDEKCGPMVRWRDGAMALDDGPGEAMHPAPYEFLVTTRSPEHPVMRGLPSEWLHATDELYSQLRGPAKGLTVLATARAERDRDKGTGENEPMLMTIEYGAGRVFHTTLGHVHFDVTEAPEAVRCSGFVATLNRGVEWAATGEVTQKLPEDFPGENEAVVRP